MKNNVGFALLILILSLVVTSIELFADDSRATDTVFSHWDHKKGVIVTDEELAMPNTYKHAICSISGEMEIAFAGEIANKHPGSRHLFKYDTKGKGAYTDMCLLFGDTFSKNLKVEHIAVVRRYPSCDKAMLGKIAFFNKKKIENCWVSGNTGLGQVVTVLYEANPKSYLATIYYLQDSHVYAYDMDSVPQEEGNTCWRVGDGCQFFPESKRIVAILEKENHINLFLLDSGPEGFNMVLLQPDGNKLVETQRKYVYWGPN